MPQTGSAMSGQHRPWEPPRLTEFKIGVHTKSRGKDDPARPAEPPPSASPASKLGFAFEWSLPLAYNETTK